MGASETHAMRSSGEKSYEEVRKAWRDAHVQPLWENPLAHSERNEVRAAYNHAQYLPGCLNSLLQQSVQLLEIIVIDDASTDNSVAIIEEFAAKHPVIRVVKNERNRGVVHNMNEGWKQALGEYIYYAAADDLVQQ